MRKKSFQDRYEKVKRELDPPKKGPAEFSHMAWRASADMLAGIIVGAGLGLAFDYYMGTAHWGLIIGFLLGSSAGMLNVYRSLCKAGFGFGLETLKK